MIHKQIDNLPLCSEITHLLNNNQVAHLDVRALHLNFACGEKRNELNETQGGGGRRKEQRVCCEETKKTVNRR